MNSKASFSWAAPIFCLAAYFQWDIADTISGSEFEFAAYLMLGAYAVMAIALFGKMYNILPVIGIGAGALSTILTALNITELMEDLLSIESDEVTLLVISYYIGQLLVIGAFVFVFLNVFFSIPQFSYLSNWDTMRGETLWYLCPILMLVGHLLPIALLFHKAKIKVDDFFEYVEYISGDDSAMLKCLLFLASITFCWGLACKWYSDAGNRPIRHHRNVYNTSPYQQNPYQQQPYQQQPYQQNPYQQQPYQQQPYQQQPYQQQPYQQQPYQQQPYQQNPYQQPQTAPQDPSQNESAERQDG